MSDEKPFPENGDQHGAVPAVQQPPSQSSAEPQALGVANEPVCALCGAGRQADGLCANGHPVCSCGALPHADRDGFCASNHPFKGHGGKLSLKHGRYAQQPPIDSDGAEMASASQRQQVLRRLFDAISREAARYADASRTHRLNARDQQQLLNMVERLGTIDGRIRELEGSATSAPETGAIDNAARVRKIARLFSNEPDLFSEFITELLAADRLLAVPLRIALDQLEPTGVPRALSATDDSDTVLL